MRIVARLFCSLSGVLLWLSFSHAAFASCTTPPGSTNAIEAENCKPGNPDTEWDITGAGDPTIQGFATDISYNVGSTAQFKIDTAATAYTLDIYRMGYYSGMGARKVASILPSAALPQTQPACTTDTTAGLGGSGLADCGNWAVSASWDIPADATSGIYFALLKRTDTGGKSHIVFIVRNDASHSDLLFQTSDTTWQAYNHYGLGSLYGSNSGQGDITRRSFKVSYNRPFLTRELRAYNWVFDTEYPMVRWLEANGYDVTYFSGVDSARSGSRILQHKAFLSVGHDEYWSGDQRSNVEAARSAGVHLAFFSGNEAFWKTRWENSIDGSNTQYRTLVTYKETHANAHTDPLNASWTGTWRDPRFSPPGDGGRPENALTGTLFMVNGTNFGSIQVPAADGNMRFWRNTTIANQPAGQVATLPDGTLGFEWDIDADNGFRPPGLFHLSTATYNLTRVLLLDFGSTYGDGTATHHMTLYRATSGALVFGAGTIRWPWGLDSDHDTANFDAFPADARMQQATINLFADMGAQPATLQAGLTPAFQSTDVTPPSSVITSPPSGTSVQAGTVVTVAGTAADQGGAVAGVEVSLDGGASWHPAVGRGTWSYAWLASKAGSFTVLSRAVDDSGNLETPSASVNVTVTCPCSTLSAASTPLLVDSNDPSAVELGVKFRSDVNGFITSIRFYKNAANTGTHVGNLWTKDGALLSSATFTNETAAGWQQVNFPTAIAITAGKTYVASYFAPNGHFSVDTDYFTSAGVDNFPLHFLKDGADGGNGVFTYGPSSSFPNSTFRSSNYWVDVVLVNGIVTAISPPAGASAVSVATSVAAKFDRPLDPLTVNGTNFQLWDSANSQVPATVAYDVNSSTATLTPSSALTTAATYTALLSGTTGALTDAFGHPLGLNFSWQFTTCCSAWSSTIVPAIISNDPAAVEVGVKFRSDVNGFVTGIRFYKGALNTGTHVGHLWTKDGMLISTATFTNETASGWQQVSFPSAIAISAGTTYIASYFAPNGRYSLGLDYFASSGVDSPPIHLLKDGDDGGNGVFSYGPGGTFPTSSFRSSNYWVDVLFATSLAGLSGPTITSISPPSGATGVSVAADVKVNFSKDLDPTTINGINFQLLDSTGSPVPASVSYRPDAFSVTLSPTYGFEFGNLYRVAVTGGSAGVRDASANPMTASVLWFFTTEPAPPGSCPCFVLNAAGTPAIADSGDAAAVEVGVKFRSDENGFITGLRFYKSAANTGTHLGHLWTKGGTLLGTAIFTSETSSGWQQVNFPSAIAITAGTTYVASYFAPSGHYSVSPDYFASAAVVNAPLRFLQDGQDGSNGVFSYGASGVVPTSTFRSSNYWVDVAFTKNVGGVFGPTVTNVSPSSAATGVNIGTSISAAFDRPLDPTSVNTNTFRLLDSTNGVVPGTVTYDSSTRTATLTPDSALGLLTSYRPLVVGRAEGIKDAGGHPMRSSVSWLFTTQPTPAGSCPCSVWNPNAIPSVSDSGDSAAIEVGVKFRSDVNGFISGIRFYKNVANSGTHIGHLWSRDGTLLATATFTTETASGWQQVSFPAAVPINAGTTYIASYFAPNGHYAVDDLQFATAGVDNPPLHMLQDGLDGGNGVFNYSPSSIFPTTTFRSRNYWVDVVFDNGTPRPTVASVAPSNGDPPVSPATTVTAIFGTAMDPATINSSTFLLLDQFNAVISAAVTYDATTNTATLTPTVPLPGAASYRAVIRGGGVEPRVKNLNGLSLISDYNWSFATASQLVSLALDATTVQGGTAVNGTVTLRITAPASGVTVQLSSSNSAVASVPASVTVPAGASSATFVVSTFAVTGSTPVTITASQDVVKTVGLTVNPAPLSSLTLNPISVFSRGTSVGTLTLSLPAPASGLTVPLASDNPAATVPASITFAAGATTGTFNVTTSDVSATTLATITATLNGVKSAVLTINPIVVSNLVLTPTTVIAGASSTATVTLNAAAPTGGVSVALTSSNTAAASMPAAVTIAAGATTGTFSVSTSGVSASTPVTISATLNGVKTAVLTVNPPALLTLTLNPTSVVGGNNSTGTVTLNGVAPPGGATVTLSDTNPAAVVPASVVIAAGATSATFTVTTSGVTANATGAVSASYSGVVKTANLTVTPAALSSIALSPATVVGPASSTATVTLSGAAPPEGALITLSTVNAAATVPANVVVPAGLRTATFTVSTVAVGATTTGNVSATYRTVTRSANFTVNALFAAISLSPNSVLGGASSTATVTLNAAAPVGGLPLTLSTANPAATVPAGVTVLAGATTATFVVTTTPVGAATTGNVSATDGLSTRSVNLIVNPATLSSISRTPGTVVGGNPVTGTATLNGAAPAGGAVVTLTDSSPALSVPASITIPAGATSVTFTISTVPVTAITTGTVSGTLGVTRTSPTITVDTADLTSLTLNPSTLAGGNQSIGTVTLTGNAPVDATVSIFSFNDPIAAVPVSVVIPAGSKSATFVINTAQVTANTNVTISSVYQGNTRNATLTVRPPRLVSVTLNPATVAGGTPSTGTVTLDGPAAAAGTPVTLSSNNTAAATVPASVLVPAGQTSATFTATTKVVATSATVTITGNRVVSQTAALTVTP